jgi:probable HAF family extracellular repeat protein
MSAFHRQKPPSCLRGRDKRTPRASPRIEILENRRVLSGYNFVTIDYPGSNYNTAAGINDAGQIVGSYALPTSSLFHGFLKDSEGYQSIDYPGSTQTQAYGINGAGEIVGYYEDASGAAHGFLKDSDVYHSIDYPGSILTFANGINNAGQIVGVYIDNSEQTHAFLKDNGGYHSIDPPGSTYARAFAINNVGQILGGYYNGPVFQYFLIGSGGYQSINYPGSTSQFYDVGGGINDAGQVVGKYDQIVGTPPFTSEVPHGFLKDSGGYHTIDYPGGAPTEAYGINDAGQIVGEYNNAGAFLATPVQTRVVNVVTPGFNPNPTDWTGFRAPFVNLATELDNVLPQGTALQGEVNSYVTQWDSDSGWIGAAAWVAASLLPGVPESLALQTARTFLNVAGQHAEQAAQTADADLTNPQNSYLGPPSDGQLIQLIGHSRGAAVNARLSQLLTAQGYTVDQYISLDGFSTDWPFPSNILGDISIVSTASATRKVNYEVQQSLLPALIQASGNFIGLTLTSDEITELLNAVTDWRAPPRAGFENEVIAGPSPQGDPLSNHLNIVDIYSNLQNPYLKEDFDKLTSGSSNSASQAAALTSSLVVSPAISANDAPPDYGSFQDGSFESLGSLQKEVASAGINVGDSALLAYCLSLVEDPVQLLAAEWTVSGDAVLVQSGGNTLAELSQSASGTSISQYLELDSQASSIGFDMSVLSAKPGDQLQVLLGSNILGTFDLSSLPSSGHEIVSLAGYSPQDGEVTFQLVGPEGDTAVIQLDNLTVNEATSVSAVSGAGTYGATATLIATLSTGETPLSGKTVAFGVSEGGTVVGVGSAITSPDGVAVLTGVTLASFNAGTASGAITARFDGDSTDLSSSANGGLTVNQAPLVIQADDKIREVGQPNVPLTSSYFGFVNGDSPASLASPVLLATSATAESPAGVYPITVGGAASRNYAITLKAGKLTVTQPPLVIITKVQAVTNKKHLVKQLIVNLSGAVNSSEAQQVGTYRLATAGKKNSFDAKNAKLIKLKSAVYGTANDSITITPMKPFALTKPVQFRINGQTPLGLQDSSGRLIDGDHNGTPGGNAVAILSRRGASVQVIASGATAGQNAENMAIVDALFERDAFAGLTAGRRVRHQ